MLKPHSRILGAIAMLTVLGCGSGADNGNGPTGSISLVPSATALTLEQGATGTLGVTLTRGGGFADPVTVTVEGLPIGVTATVTPSQLTGSTTQATVMVTVATAVAPATYTATVRGSAPGVGAATAQYTLTVTAQPNYTLSLRQTPITIAAGGSTQDTVHIARTNFAGAVTLSLDAPPSGFTATFRPPASTGDSSVVTISVAASVVPGNYTVTIKGTASGVSTAVAGLIDEAAAAGDRTTTLAINVVQAADFTIAATPNAGNAPLGGSTTSAIAVTPSSNHTANIALSLVNPPTGITGTFAPATLSGGTLSSTLTLNVAANVTPGVYTITVQGAGGGVTRTTVFNLTVVSSGSQVWEFCNSTPLRFWRQSGTTWVEVKPTTVGYITRYSFDITSQMGGVAYTTSENFAARMTANGMSTRGPQRSRAKPHDRLNTSLMRAASQHVGSLTSPYFYTEVYYGLASELGRVAEGCNGPTNFVAKTFNLVGQAASDGGYLRYGTSLAALVSSFPQVTLSVLPGSYDYMAIWGRDAYRIGRNEPAPGAAVTLNRTGAPALIPFDFTVSGGNPGSLYDLSEVLDTPGGELMDITLGSGGSSATMYFPQEADRLGTDVWSLEVENTEQVGNTFNFRGSSFPLGSGPPASGAFTLAPAVPPFAVSQVQGAPVTTWQATGEVPTVYQTAAGYIQASVVGGSALYTVTATRAWLTANSFNTNYTLAGPTLPGFPTQWAPAAPLDASIVLISDSAIPATPTARIANLAIRTQCYYCAAASP